jgi:hypothetical protein
VLRGTVTPDPDGDTSVPNYGDEHREEDYARIPHRDLPFGVPAWLGDDSWRRSMPLVARRITYDAKRAWPLGGPS